VWYNVGLTQGWEADEKMQREREREKKVMREREREESDE